MRMNIVNSSREINILIFNDPIRVYRKYFRKIVETWNMQNKVLNLLAQTAHKKLLIAAEKLNFENCNDVIRAYRKYFRKVFAAWYMQHLVLYLRKLQIWRFWCIFILHKYYQNRKLFVFPYII